MEGEGGGAWSYKQNHAHRRGGGKNPEVGEGGKKKREGQRAAPFHLARKGGKKEITQSASMCRGRREKRKKADGTFTSSFFLSHCLDAGGGEECKGDQGEEEEKKEKEAILPATPLLQLPQT